MFTERAQKIAKLEELLGKDVYVLCQNRRNDEAYIDGTMIDVFRRMMRFSKKRDGAALIIQTPGGDLNESYYIGEFFKEYYDYTEAYVVSDCYSGGTIIALATDQIFLSHSGCLGPIDIQRYSMSEKKNSWYPALSGQIEALKNAKKDGEIDEFFEKTFKGEMSVLATYFRERYTYKDLIGENVKKHCEDESKWEDIWMYLAALNISHGSPLTYRKLKRLGIKVQLMSDEVEDLIKAIIFDAEKEFGGLKEKSFLYDFFESIEFHNAIGAFNHNNAIKNTNQLLTDSSTCKDSHDEEEDGEKVHLAVVKSNEKMSIIENSAIGFMQKRELGTILKNYSPQYVTVISSGWDEELDTSVIDDEQKEKLDKFLLCYANMIAGTHIEDTENLSDEDYNLVLGNTYQYAAKIAMEELKEQGIEIDNMTCSEQYKCIVNYLITSPDLISFDECVEEKMRAYGEAVGVNYDELGTSEKIDFYGEFYVAMEACMLQCMDIPREEFDALSEEEQNKMVTDFILNSEIEGE